MKKASPQTDLYEETLYLEGIYKITVRCPVER